MLRRRSRLLRRRAFEPTERPRVGPRNVIYLNISSHSTGYRYAYLNQTPDSAFRENPFMRGVLDVKSRIERVDGDQIDKMVGYRTLDRWDAGPSHS